jgi:hypothetical protein
MDSDEVNELFLEYCKTLPFSVQKEINDGNDFLSNLSYDAEEDLKEEIWNRIKYSNNYMKLISMLKDYILPGIEAEEEEEEEAEEEESDS